MTSTLRIRVAALLIRAADHFGPLHIIVSDGNVEDDDIHWGYAALAEGPVWPADQRCIDFLSRMSVQEREQAWTMATR